MATFHVGVAEPHRYAAPASVDDLMDSIEGSVRRLVAKGEGSTAALVFNAFAAALREGKARRAAPTNAKRSVLATRSAAGHRRPAEAHPGARAGAVRMSVAERERAATFVPTSSLLVHVAMRGGDLAPHAERLAETERRRRAAASYVPRDPRQIGEAIPLSAQERSKAAEFMAPTSMVDVWKQMQGQPKAPPRTRGKSYNDSGSYMGGTDNRRKASNGMPRRDDDDAEDFEAHSAAMRKLQRGGR